MSTGPKPYSPKPFRIAVPDATLVDLKKRLQDVRWPDEVAPGWDYGVDLQKRFFECYLKGVDNGWSEQPRVQLQIRHVDRFVQRYEDEWPIARTQWTRFYLDPADQSLGRNPAPSAGSGSL